MTGIPGAISVCGETWHLLRVQSDDRGAFDEIVVGEWLHIENMLAGDYDVHIGA